jgi:hypothetical protein
MSVVVFYIRLFLQSPFERRLILFYMISYAVVVIYNGLL